MANNELLTLDDQTLASIMNKRHRSAAKSFKSPPQPRFCIKECLEDGRDVFINVLSYSRIASQLSELDPVPLYGGMIIKSYSSLKNSLHQQQALTGMHAPPPPSSSITSIYLIRTKLINIITSLSRHWKRCFAPTAASSSVAANFCRHGIA
jgi:hypothetical protein